MMASVWTRKLRVVMYTGFGSPVEPEVKLTKPGQVRNGAPAARPGRASGTATVSMPRGSPAAARPRSDGARNSGVPSGRGGAVRHALGSGGNTAKGSGRLESAKSRATASGWVERAIAGAVADGR